MKAESATMPVSPYEIEYDGELAKITFYENVQELETVEGESKKWEYDIYFLHVRNRDNLIAHIENNVDAWTQTAKDLEYNDLASKIRTKRNGLLAECDWTQITDASLSSEEKEIWRVYRQALRDIPQQPEFPYRINWPVVE